jgi:hypothetical protein
MAYNAPELLLVGSAQNLVLGAIEHNTAGPSFRRELEDFADYDDTGLW